jgi:excisionase family DNA binding protein
VSTNPNQLAYEVSEVCEIARISRGALYNAINAGQLRAVKRGRKTLILRSDLEAWVASLPPIRPSRKSAA